MEIIVRKGTLEDVNDIEELYNSSIDYLEAHTNYPGWKKGVYPTKEDARNGIDEDCLFVAECGHKIVGTIILRHKPEEAYATVKWKKDLDYEEVLVIYTFAIHPDYLKQGIGSKLLQFAESYAKEHKVKSIRLDVVKENLPAISAYEKNGFEYVATVDLGYEAYGLKWFHLYEKLIG